MDPADTTAAQILNDHLREWWSDIVIGAQNARWYGYSVLEAVYNENALHVNGDTITPFIGLEWIGEKPMQWYEPKNDGRLILFRNFSKSRLDEECNQHFKHFLTRCKPTYENPYGEALLSRLYWVWFFKNNGFKMWAKFVEQFELWELLLVIIFLILIHEVSSDSFLFLLQTSDYVLWFVILE